MNNTPTPAQSLGEAGERLTKSKPAPDFMTFDYVNSILRLDSETGELYWRTRLNSRRGAGERAGTISRGGGKHGDYRCLVRIHGRKYHRYRLVFLLSHGRWPAMTVDHINHDQLDDRPANLREATVNQNMYNQKPRTRANGLPRGVYQRSCGTYGARIMHRRKYIGLGTHATAEAAHAVYLEARKTYFGEFA